MSGVCVNSPYIRIFGRSAERQGDLFLVRFMAINENKMVVAYEPDKNYGDCEERPDVFDIAIGMAETANGAYERAIRRIEEDHGSHVAEEVRREWKSYSH